MEFFGPGLVLLYQGAIFFPEITPRFEPFYSSSIHVIFSKNGLTSSQIESKEVGFQGITKNENSTPENPHMLICISDGSGYKLHIIYVNTWVFWGIWVRGFLKHFCENCENRMKFSPAPSSG